MGKEELDCIPLPLKLFLRKDGVNLGVTRTADSNGLLHRFAVELPLVSFVRVSGPRDQMMPR